MVDDWGGAARSLSVSAVIFASLDEEDPEDWDIPGFSSESLRESRRVIYSTEQPLAEVECGVPMEEPSDGADRVDNEAGCEESESSIFTRTSRPWVSVEKIDNSTRFNQTRSYC